MSTTVVTEAVPTVYPPAPQRKETNVHPDPGSLKDSVFDEDEGEATTGTYALPAHLSDRSRRISTISRATFTPSFRPSDSKLNASSIPQDVIVDVSTSELPVLPSLRLRSVSDNRKFRIASRLHFAALCWCIYVEGWNDGTTGPLLPVFQRDYDVGFTTVSLYFVSNCVGFMTAAALNVWLNDRIGFGKIVVLGSIFQLTAYVMQAPGPPFPVMVIANAFTGFGMSLQNAQANGFVGSLKKHMTTKLGFLHAAYGLGAFTSPFVATFFSGTRRWSFHYLVSTALAISNTLALVLIFRGKPLHELLAEGGQPPEEQISVRQNTYREMFGLKAVHILAIFALVYIGIEVTLGGWIVTFIIHERGGGHSTGYISSGFFGGLTLGRIGLMWFNKLVGEHRVIFVYSLLTIALELTVWFVPSIIENAVAVSLIGAVLGPMYPVLVSHATKVLPRWLLTVCLGWITGIGIAGSAALPFLTGLLASRFGIGALQPLLVSMMCVMVVAWAFVPKSIRRVD